MTTSLIAHVKEARKRYGVHLKEKSLQKLKTDKDLQIEAINEQVKGANNMQIGVLESTITQLKADADKLAFEAQKKAAFLEVKATLSKLNALKRAASEKQDSLNDFVAKKKVLLEKKSAL